MSRETGAAFERAGAQTWEQLLFVHWEVPSSILRAKIPARLELDRFAGKTYVGLIPFMMRDVRPIAALPPVPTAAAFPEVNLRTYVRFGELAGVWFFSLDAASALAVVGGRAFFSLPYFRSEARITQTEDGFSFESERLWPKPQAGRFRARYSVGEPIGAAAPGTLEHFLVERYRLFAAEADGTLLTAAVRHAPYPLHRAKVERVDETLMAAARLPSNGNRTPDYCSPGVQVDIGAIERL